MGCLASPACPDRSWPRSQEWPARADVGSGLLGGFVPGPRGGPPAHRTRAHVPLCGQALLIGK
eukprot:8113000-Lingulodinium_polyedra.AAC.1